MTSSLVRDVMTTDVVTVKPSTPFKEIAARLAQHRISAVPVVEADRRVLGIITEADLLLKQEHPDPKADISPIWTRRRRRERAKAAAAVAGKLMTAPAATVAPTATVTEAARRMHAAGVKRLPVVDEAGRLVGIVSRADLLKVFTRSDEAIRSQIISEVIVGELLMDPSRFLIEVDDGVVLLQGTAERSSLIPYMVRAVHHVEGVVRVEDQLSFDVDDYDPAIAYPGCGPERADHRDRVSLTVEQMGDHTGIWRSSRSRRAPAYC